MINGWLVVLGLMALSDCIWVCLYWAISHREGERREMTDKRKNVQTTAPASAASAVGLCHTIDGWMTCYFTSFLTVFQSYQDDVWMIMKGCVQWNSVYGWEDFTSSEDLTRSARSVGQRLTHWAAGAPCHTIIQTSKTPLPAPAH